MKKLLSTLLLSTLFASLATAAVYYDLDEILEDRGTGLGISYVDINENPYSRIYLAPNFSIKSLKVGLDINYYAPLNDSPDLDDLNEVVLRHLSYDHDNKHGFAWGRLRNITLGHGLLVDAFDSGGGGTTEFTSEKAGVFAYATLYDTKISILNTNQEVQGARIERPVVELAGVPLNVGATYMKDNDGISDASSGTLVTRPEVTAMAADVSYPIGGNAAILYGEYAEIEYEDVDDKGTGWSTGVRGNILKWLDYKAEYRGLAEGFAPSYFNSAYQASSFSYAEDALTEDTSGYLVSAGTQMLGGKAKAAFQYEAYDDVNLISSALMWRDFGPTSGVLNITKPFSSDDNRLVAVLDMYYSNASQPYDLIFRYKRVYSSLDEYDQNYSVGMVLRPGRLFSIF